MDDEILIGEIPSGNIRVMIRSYNQRRFLDIRKFYHDNEGQLKPTRKGIALNKEQFEVLLQLLNQKKDKIIQDL